MCIRNTSANTDNLKTLHKGKSEENRKPRPTLRGTVNNNGEKMNTASTNTYLTNHKSHQETDKNLNTDINPLTVRPSLPHRTWSDEANGNIIPQSAPGRGSEEDALGSEQMSCVPQPKPVPAAPRKHAPIPVPRKPRKAVLTRQEKVEGEREENLCQDGRAIDVKEVKVSSEGKGSSSPFVSESVEKQPIFLSTRKACPVPAPPPSKKPLLSAPERATTSAHQALPKDVEEEDLGWYSSSHEMEVSVDKADEQVEKEGMHDQEIHYPDFTHSPPSGNSLSQPELIQTPPAEDMHVKVAPKKPQRHSSPMARMQKNDSSEEKDEGRFGGNEKRQAHPIEDGVLKERVMRELPSPPAEKTSRDLRTAGAIKPHRSSVGKQRAKSFSSADLIRSEGQKRNSFRKLLDMKLSVKMLPKLMVKGGQSPDWAVNDNEQSVDKDEGEGQNLCEQPTTKRKLSCPLIGVEQSVDGDEFSHGNEQDVYYENIPHYEEIPDYMNVHVGGAMMSPQASFSLPSAWQGSMYNDESIYEEQEPYMTFEKSTGQQRDQTPADCERYTITTFTSVCLSCFTKHLTP